MCGSQLFHRTFGIFGLDVFGCFEMVSGAEKFLEAFTVGRICMFPFYECDSARQSYPAGKFFAGHSGKGGNRLFYPMYTLVRSVDDAAGNIVHASFGTVSLESG